MAAPVRFAVVVHLLKQKGFFLHHARGSHHSFRNAEGRVFVVPVHKNQVKGIYVKQIEKL
jgi:predicted RNA binding protein YcfA (HicA-like mRNA interferase family)